MIKEESLALKVREYISTRQGRDIHITDLRKDLGITDPTTPEWDNLFTIINRLVKGRQLKYSGKRDGVYRVITPVSPIRVFIPDRKIRPLFPLVFPRDFNTMLEMDFAKDIVIREGDLITIGGVKSQGKTTLALSFAGENIDDHPVLMGNEYTILTDNGFDVAPRFYNRLQVMGEWIQWVDDKGEDKFTLLPVSDDYAEHIVKNKINIIDWINLDGDKSYDIGKVLYGIKASLGRGIGIVALQKGEGAVNPRGGQFVRDFSDLEILLDGFGDTDGDILLTLKGVKEKLTPIVGKTFAYTIIGNGVKIVNFREVTKCPSCKGQGFNKDGKCNICYGNKFVDK